MEGFVPRVVVKFVDKFVDNLGTTYHDQLENDFVDPEKSLWAALVGDFPGITLIRLYTTLSPNDIVALANKAELRDATYHAPDFLSYFAVDCPKNVEPQELADRFNKQWDSVEIAYDQGLPGPLPAVSFGNDPRSQFQLYLEAAPGGINAKFAWAKVVPGGAGEGIGFVDMEDGWQLDHVDLADAAGNPVVTALPGVNLLNREHGTRVLGVVVAVDNATGDVGIATHATARVISVYRPGSTASSPPDPADAIKTAALVMAAGDVLLLEEQFVETLTGRQWPIEALQAVYDEIKQATALGIIVIEPAGNGLKVGQSSILEGVGQNLANYTDQNGKHVLDPNNAGEFKDSGAIVVGAGTRIAPHSRMGFSNFGDRVDCYAWGEDVHTLDINTSTGAPDYTFFFNGTSSASAIVAGAALVVQSVAVAKGFGRITPDKPRNIRTIFRDPARGTPSANPAVDRIKYMPDLKLILINEFGVPP